MTAESAVVALSVVIPACNEEPTIGACLEALLAQRVAQTIEVIVAANACIDRTVAVAQTFAGRFEQRGWRFEVLDLADGGKTGAFNAAERCATAGSRMFLDADVVCGHGLLAGVLRALDSTAPVYASGRLTIPEPQSVWSRRYARAWLRMPFAAKTICGAGLFAVNAAGRARWGAFPKTFADDLYVRLLFAPHERRLVDAPFAWPAPEGFGDIVRTRRRQDAHTRALLSAHPHLTENEDKGRLGPATLARVFSQGPLDFLAYVAILLCARAVRPGQADHRARRWLVAAPPG